MHSKLNSNLRILSLVSIGILTLVGCQGGLTSIPSLNSFNNPTRVPPPPAGSFQVPANYTDPTGGGASTARSRPTTLGQLRSIETGKSSGDRIETDGFVASEVTNDAFAFTTKPVAASAATLTSAKSAPSNFNPVRTASSNFATESNGPAIVPAASIQELPVLRNNATARGSLNSGEESVKWKTPQPR